MTRHSIWIAVGVLLLVVIALLNLVAIVGPAYVAGMVIAQPGSSALSNLGAGMRFYVTEMQKDSRLTLGSIYYRLAFNSVFAISLIAMAVFLSFRKTWAWKALFGILAVATLNFMVLLAAAILQNPAGFSFTWLLGSVGLDSLILYGAVLLIFWSRPIRAIYGVPRRT